MPQYEQAELKGMVLAGGKSRRLGRDKALVALSGRSLLTRSVNLLQSFCTQVRISGRTAATGPSDGLEGSTQDHAHIWLPDDKPGMGPIGGILTGLERLQAPLLVIACDLPLMNRETLHTLIEARKSRPGHAVMTTYQQIDTKFIEALVSIYEPEAIPLLREACQRKQYALSKAIPEQFRLHVPYVREDNSAFFNVNYPEDLEKLSKILTGQTLHVPERSTGEPSC